MFTQAAHRWVLFITRWYCVDIIQYSASCHVLLVTIFPLTMMRSVSPPSFLCLSSWTSWRLLSRWSGVRSWCMKTGSNLLSFVFLKFFDLLKILSFWLSDTATSLMGLGLASGPSWRLPRRVKLLTETSSQFSSCRSSEISSPSSFFADSMLPTDGSRNPWMMAEFFLLCISSCSSLSSHIVLVCWWSDAISASTPDICVFALRWAWFISERSVRHICLVLSFYCF